jgi:hypothetical protein
MPWVCCVTSPCCTLNFACHSTSSCSAPPPVFARQRGDALPRHGRVTHCSAMQSAATPAHVAALHARLTATPARTRFDSATRPTGRRSPLGSYARADPERSKVSSVLIARGCAYRIPRLLLCCIACGRGAYVSHVAPVSRAAVHWIAVQCIAVRRIAVRCIAVRCGAMRCGALHCTALLCTALPAWIVRLDKMQHATCYRQHITRIQRAFNAHSTPTPLAQIVRLDNAYVVTVLFAVRHRC